MNLSIFGLGRVGGVSAACLAAQGHRVIGVDINPAFVAAISAGRSPVSEPGLEDMIRAAVAGGGLSATADAAQAIAESDMTLVCVGTPGHADGTVSLETISAAAVQIGQALRVKTGRHRIVFRSTVPPGTTREVLAPLLAEASGMTPGVDFGLAYSPEFLREGTGIADFRAPTRIVVGALDDETAQAVLALHAQDGAAPFVVDLESAELAKYVDNAWHALKVVFGNEVGAIGKALGVDGRALIDILAADPRLNLSAAYLRPAFAFGGSCLPKDVRALDALARARGVAAPVLGQVMASNAALIEQGALWVRSFEVTRIALLDGSFKAGVNDWRESPFVALANRLSESGCEVRILESGESPAAALNWAQAVIATGSEAASLLAVHDFNGPILDFSLDGLDGAAGRVQRFL